MSERFFSGSPIAGNLAVLTGDEARHLAAVMRAAIGDEVLLFDGRGAEFIGRIRALRKRDVELEILERREISRELPSELTLAVALPKGDRQKWLVEKATELGATRLVPLATERGVALPVEAALERLRRAVIEASKQSGRNVLLHVEPAREAVAYLREASHAGLRIIADPEGGPLPDRKSVGPTIAAVGPEGGFSPAELAAAKSAGWQSVSLGPRILRVETAAVAIAAWAALGATSAGQ